MDTLVFRFSVEVDGRGVKSDATVDLKVLGCLPHEDRVEAIKGAIVDLIGSVMREAETRNIYHANQ
jgi:hypothetical protein